MTPELSHALTDLIETVPILLFFGFIIYMMSKDN